MRTTVPLLLATLALAGGVQAQQPTAPAEARLQAAFELPRLATEAREAGIPERDVRETLEGGRKAGASPEVIGPALEEGAKAARENGPIDNFGAFVTERVRAGLRGQELAEAIRAEHRARGKGRPEDAGGGKPADAGSGKSAQAGGGKPADAGSGKSAQAGGGKPAQAGGGRSAQGGGSQGHGKAKNGH